MIGSGLVVSYSTFAIIYLSVFYLIGLLISTASLAERLLPLMLSMVVWSSLVLIYPSLSIFAVNRLWDTSAQLESAYGEIEQIWETFERERMDFVKRDPVADDDTGYDILKGSGSRGTFQTSDVITLKVYIYVKSQSVGG